MFHPPTHCTLSLSEWVQIVSHAKLLSHIELNPKVSSSLLFWCQRIVHLQRSLGVIVDLCRAFSPVPSLLSCSKFNLNSPSQFKRPPCSLRLSVFCLFSTLLPTQTWLRAWAPLCSPSICLVIRYRNADTAFCFFGLIKWESMVSPKSKIFPIESKQQQQRPLFPWPCYSVLAWVFFLTNVFMWTWSSFLHLNGSKSLIVFAVFRDVFVSKCKGLPVTDTHLLV